MTELIIDSFAGGGGASLGIEMALGRSPDYAINHDEKALAMHQANHPNTVHLSKNIWQIDPMDVVGRRPVGLLWASPDCFPAGTMVLARQGYVPIEEISIGDEVLTHQGRWRRVTETSSAMRPLRRIRGHGHPGLLVSPEHPFYARLRTDVWSNEKPRGYRRTWAKPEWAPASLLDKGWYWSSPRQFPTDEAPEVPVVGNRRLKVDNRLLWLAGRYIADGWTRLSDRRAELVITCGKHEVEELRWRLSKWERKGARSGDDEIAWHERATGTAYQFTTSSRGLVTWLREHFGHGAANKRIPGWALGLDELHRRSLIDGYLSGDGSTVKTKSGVVMEQAYSVSKALAFGIKALAATFGAAAQVYLNENQTDVIEGRRVNALPIWAVRWRVEVAEGHQQTFEEGGHIWSPIRAQEHASDCAQVFNIGVEEDESYVVDGIVVHNCKHFSKAKGGKPVKRNVRDLAWTVVLWAKRARPRVIILENVEEFRDWGPLTLDGKPCKDRKGQTFTKWVRELKRLGYKVEWRELRACDYGAPTIRKRLFVIARRDGQPIVWPKPTHGSPDSEGVKAGTLQPWRTAAEIIDWSLPCPSIFDTADEIKEKFGLRAKRPLADATLRRIARGVAKFVLDAKRPFIVRTAHGDVGKNGSRRWGHGEHSLDAPLPTIATSNDCALASPFVTKFRTGATGHAMDEPLATVTANGESKRPGGAVPLGIVAPTLIQAGFGEREGQAPRAPGLDKPVGTQVAGASKHAVVAAFLAQHNAGPRPGQQSKPADAPMSTVTTTGAQQGVVAAHMMTMRGSERRGAACDDPLNTLSAGGQHAALVAAFMDSYYGTDQAPDMDGPMPTDTTRDRRSLVTVDIDGETFVISDIGLRMLTPRERFRAQGFHDGYIIDHGVLPDGSTIPLTQEVQGRCCGNSVCPPLAHALVDANCADLAHIMEAAE